MTNCGCNVYLTFKAAKCYIPENPVIHHKKRFALAMQKTASRRKKFLFF